MALKFMHNMPDNAPESDNDPTIIEEGKEGKEDKQQYTAAFANPYKRFVSHIIDSLIIYSVITLVSFFIVRDEIREEINKINESSIVVESKKDTKSADNMTIVTINDNSNDIFEKKYSAIENVIFKKLTKNKFFRYMIFIVPNIYYILFLYY